MTPLRHLVEQAEAWLARAGTVDGNERRLALDHASDLLGWAHDVGMGWASIEQAQIGGKVVEAVVWRVRQEDATPGNPFREREIQRAPGAKKARAA